MIVEDFGAPFSVALSPLFNRRPVVGSVQWLFGSEMRRKYGPPFDLVQDGGLRLYDDFIAVSGWLAEELRRRRPNAQIEVIPNGVDPEAFLQPATPPAHLLFVGRLDREQKGVDYLVDVAAQLKQLLGPAMPPLLIVGEGRDRAALEIAVRGRGLTDTVRLLGQVQGQAKFELMAAAHAVLMPSRFETFAMVAVEAQSVGVPIVAFDVGPLREVAGPGGARLVPPFDVTAFANEVAGLVANPAARLELRARGQDWARRYDWEEIAGAVEAHLLRAAAQGRERAAQSRPRTGRKLDPVRHRPSSHESAERRDEAAVRGA